MMWKKTSCIAGIKLSGVSGRSAKSVVFGLVGHCLAVQTQTFIIRKDYVQPIVS